MSEVELLISMLALADCVIIFVIGAMITFIGKLMLDNYFDKLTEEYNKEEYKYI